METEFARITQRAREFPQEKFFSLMGKVFSLEGLRESFRAQSRRKAPGIDGVRKDDYAIEVEGKLQKLSDDLRKMGYRPPPVRRTYIPKASGGQRPLGIPTFESRLVQDRVAKVLQAIWEPEFLGDSYGYRAGKSQHDALRAVHEAIMSEGVQYVVEADIKGFFNHVAHEHLMKFLEYRIKDPNFLRLVRRFLKAGVMEDGAFSASNEGTPQGGLVSPVLSNIYLHNVLDVWFQQFAASCKGQARLIRYADDFIACFEHQEDAERYYAEMPVRLAAYSLEIEPTKTCLIPFGLRQPTEHNGTFTFLGFTHYIGTSRKGRPKLGRKTAKKKFQLKLKEASDRLQKLRTQGTAAMVRYVRQHLQGHLNYYGVSENTRSMATYCYRVRALLFKWLNRRSNRRSCNWQTFGAWYTRLKMPTPRIRVSFYT